MDKKYDYAILLVEDAESILIAINDHLNRYFDVFPCSNVKAAREEIEKRKKEGSHFDLLITDIHLPDDTGFALIEYCRENSPSTILSLITSYDINDYIDLIYEQGISHVISKQSNLTLKYIYVMAHKLLTSDIFSVTKYFEDIKVHYPSEMPSELGLKNRKLFSITIRSPEERIYWVDKISLMFQDTMDIPESRVKLILEEITMNAMLRAPRYEDNTYKFQKKLPDSDRLVPKSEIHLEAEDHFVIQFGYYDDFMILVCQDRYGTLRKKEVLYRLKRHIDLNPETGLPDGLNDSHGRGFFLLREQLTHLIVNIKCDQKTEIICMYSKKCDTAYKNISIYEIR